jgi:flagellar operon protein
VLFISFKELISYSPSKSPLKFSGHAIQRVQERNINMNPSLMQKLGGAVDRAAAKGVEDTLILTSDAAFIVNVKNRTVVTAMERGALNENVFTNIDGAIVVS